MGISCSLELLVPDCKELRIRSLSEIQAKMIQVWTVLKKLIASDSLEKEVSNLVNLDERDRPGFPIPDSLLV
jgi:hypothetical protein